MTSRNDSGEGHGSAEGGSGTITAGDGVRGWWTLVSVMSSDGRRVDQPSSVHHAERIETMIKHSIDINRPAEDVFAYLEQVDRHNEWQGQLVSTTVETDGPTRVGTRVVEHRNLPGGTRDFSYEVTEHEPPRKTSFRGTAGLVRPVGTYTVDPKGESSSRMNVELDFEGHGVGKLFAVLARRQAVKEVPVDHEKFKERLENGAALAASN
jgi:uncharacterized membrane protein